MTGLRLTSAFLSSACAVLGACWTEAPAPAPLVLAPPTPSARTRAAPRSPYAPVVGAWLGHGVQYDNNSDWDIELVFRELGDVGEPIGTVEYPGLDCGGVLIRRPERDGMLVAREQITHGTDCVDGGTFEFSLPGSAHPNPALMAWKWLTPESGEVDAEGAVHRK